MRMTFTQIKASTWIFCIQTCLFSYSIVPESIYLKCCTTCDSLPSSDLANSELNLNLCWIIWGLKHSNRTTWTLRKLACWLLLHAFALKAVLYIACQLQVPIWPTEPAKKLPCGKSQSPTCSKCCRFYDWFVDKSHIYSHLFIHTHIIYYLQHLIGNRAPGLRHWFIILFSVQGRSHML